MFNSRFTIIKSLELATATACFLLHCLTARELDSSTIILASGTFFSYTIILAGWYVVHLRTKAIDKPINMGISLIGLLLFTVTGVLILREWAKSDYDRVHNFFYYSGSPDTFHSDTWVSLIDRQKPPQPFATDHYFSSGTRFMAVVKGVMAIVNGVIFIIDFVFIYKT